MLRKFFAHGSTRRPSAGSDFIKRVLCPEGCTPWRPPTVEKCTFLPRAEKYQKSRPKGDEPTVRPLWGDSFGSFLLAAEKNTSPPSVVFTACVCQGQRTYFPKSLPADVRRVHFSTVGGLHGVRLPRPKNFFKNASRRRSASTLLHRRWPPRRELAKAKELIFQKSLTADVRRVHFSTVGGLHGGSPPRLKNLFFKNRLPQTFGEYTSPPSVAATASSAKGAELI